MNPVLKPILVFLSGAVLLLYLGTFAWFAWAALFGDGGAAELAYLGPLEGQANEAVAYVWTTVSLLVGGVVAVAFGQPAPKPPAVSIPTEKIVVAYAWAFMAVGLIAVVVWIAAGGNGGASLLIKNAAVAFFGLAVPILTSFLKLPAVPTISPATFPAADAASRQFALSRIEEMEDVAPPPQPELGPDDAREATGADFKAFESLAVAKSIAGAAALFRKRCEGDDSYENNCAHFLSDAFLRAGYTELQAPAPCINARCGTSAKRPIRARDMWCWFKDMATETRNSLPTNEGFWAVFQLDESAYWGGHVIIFDSDRNVYYGTGHFPAWAQHCYKW